MYQLSETTVKLVKRTSSLTKFFVAQLFPQRKGSRVNGDLVGAEEHLQVVFQGLLLFNGGCSHQGVMPYIYSTHCAPASLAGHISGFAASPACLRSI
jgi:hypothetical protein